MWVLIIALANGFGYVTEAPVTIYFNDRATCEQAAADFRNKRIDGGKDWAKCYPYAVPMAERR